MINKFNSLLVGRVTVFKNFFALGILQGTNFLIPLIIMPYLIKTIGIEGYGIFSFVQAVMIYFYSLTDYGFPITATREIALNKENKNKISAIFSKVLFIKLLLTAGSALILLVLISIIPQFHEEKKSFIFGFSIVIGQSILPIWFFQGIEKMKYITYINLAAKILFVALIFLFINENDDYPFVLFFFGLGNIISGLIGIIYAKRKFKLSWIQPSFKEVKIELKNGWSLFTANFMTASYTNSNLFILGLFTSNIVTGYYSVAEKIIMGIRQILVVFSQAIYPHICHLAEKGFDQLIKFYKQIFIPFFILIAILSLGTFVYAEQIIFLLTKSPSVYSVQLLKWLTLVPIIVALNIPAYQSLLAYDLRKSYSLIAITGSVLNIFLNVILASKYSAFGTVASVIITEAFITMGLYLIFNLRHKKGIV